MGEFKKENFVYTPVYSEEQQKRIREEFSRIKGECYLEHAGATLYSERQLANAFAELSTRLYGNPHSHSKSSKLTGDVVDQMRFRVLQHFNTDAEEYSVIFTSGATAALKLVAETFQYGTKGAFVYLTDNHTSVLGMREYAPNTISLDRGAAITAFARCSGQFTKEDSANNSLFVYPVQCNFSGTKYPFSWIKQTQTGTLNCINCGPKSTKWFCMLDASCYASTNFLDLSKYTPDFVCVSFYKIFGYPSGLGALLVKNTSGYVLEKKYFGGGTVLMALASEQMHVSRPTLHDRFEDGTLPFLSIIALRHGFEVFQRLGITMDDISKHTFNLASYVIHTMYNFQHANGEPVAVLYHDSNFDDISLQGGIVNFNLLRPNGRYVGYSEVLHISNLYGIHLRTGCFCNPGACQRHLRLSSEDVKYHFSSGHVCGDQNDLIDGYPTGSIRISFGYMSTQLDADTFLHMIRDYFVSKPLTVHNGSSSQKTTGTTHFTEHKGTLKHIFVYPVKSCAAFMVSKQWKIVETGLQYDRQWMIINSNGVAVTQKTDACLALIRPQILVRQSLLQLNYAGIENITVPLNIVQNTIASSSMCQTKVCNDRVKGFDCGDDVAEWLVEALGIPGLRLVRQYTGSEPHIRKYKKDSTGVPLSFSNEAQFLLINVASAQWLKNHISPDADFNGSVNSIIAQFRPNFVAELSHPFVENSCKWLTIGPLTFKNEGACTRCQMVCINQSTGEKTVEPLKTLSQVFNGKIKFGIYLNNSSNKCGAVCASDGILCVVGAVKKAYQLL